MDTAHGTPAVAECGLRQIQHGALDSLNGLHYVGRTRFKRDVERDGCLAHGHGHVERRCTTPDSPMRADSPTAAALAITQSCISLFSLTSQ